MSISRDDAVADDFERLGLPRPDVAHPFDPAAPAAPAPLLRWLSAHRTGAAPLAEGEARHLRLPPGEDAAAWTPSAAVLHEPVVATGPAVAASPLVHAGSSNDAFAADRLAGFHWSDGLAALQAPGAGSPAVFLGAPHQPLAAVPTITVSDAVADESSGNLAFVVTLSEASTQSVSVSYNCSNSTAANGSDYVAQSGTVTFSPGQTTQTVLIPLVDNATAEVTEFMSLNLFSPVNATIVREPAWGTIVDDDAATGTPLIRASDPVVDESAGTVTFTLTLDRPSTGTVKVDVATADGTALAGSDYVAKSTQTISFAAGEVVKTVTVNLSNDSTAEGGEYFDLKLTNPVGATLLTQAHGRANIGANDAPAVASPTITVSDAVASEVDGMLQFVVTLSAPSTQTVSVSYNNSNWTAANGSDYLAQADTLVFTPGQTTQTVLVPVLDNATLENTEYLTLNLFSPVNATIARQAGWGTIVDNDAASGTPVVRASDPVVDEAAGTVTFTLTLDRPASGIVKVDYASANGTAVAGSDYVAQPTRTLSFVPGEVSKTITIDLINDSTAEGGEYFDLKLSNPVGATLLPQAHGRATIGANDAPAVAAPLISVSDAVVDETAGTMQFIVSLNAPSTQTVSVSYNNSNVTAANGSDYQATSGTLVFTPGQTTQTVTVPVLDNATLENTEFLTLNLFSAVNGSIVRQSGWGSIVDDDAASGTPVVRASDPVVDEAAGTATFTITLDRPSTGTVSVNVATANGTAKAGSDFVGQGSHTLSFLPGEVSQTFTVDLINDGSAEGREYFDLVLSHPVGVTLLAQPHGRASIGANDAAPVSAPLITVSDAVAGEGDGMLQFVVTLNAPSNQVVSVSYNNSNQTAANGSDYLATSGTLVFAPGQTSQVVQVAVLDNTTDESSEALTLNLFSAVNGTIVRQTGWGTIVDNDATTGTPVVQVADQVVDEAAGTVSITLVLDKPSVGITSVNYSTTSGTASAGADFVNQTSRTVSFLPGEVSKTIVVDLVNDAGNEPGEYFNLVLSNPVGVEIPDPRSKVYIAPSDAPTVSSPLITVSDAAVDETGGNLVFTVSLNAPSTQVVSVAYNNSNATAASGSDYVAQSGTLVFAPGQTTQTVVIPVLDGTAQEATEYMKLNLFSAVNGTVVRQDGWGSIVDNDATTGTPAVSVGDGIVDESAARVAFTVTLDKPSTSVVSVNVAPTDGTALAGADYEAQPIQTLVFAPGEVAKTVYVNLRPDASFENTEYFDLSLSSVVNATVADPRGHAFIPQNDGSPIAVPTISAAAHSADEGGGYIDFVVTLDAPSTQLVSVGYSNSNATALNGSDYQAQSGTLYFAPGETMQVVRIPVIDDLAVESTETFKLNLFNAVNGQVGTSEVVASIVDNDNGPPPVQVIDVGTGNADILIGRPGANEVQGGQGNDALDGVAGVVMRGGVGNDLYIVESGNDKVSEVFNEGIDKVASYVSYTLGTNVENLILRGTAPNGTGNNLDNAITGNAVDNQLAGLDGKDALNGGAGNDTLDGGTGIDVLTGGTGADTFVFANLTGVDTVTDFSAVDDTVRISQAGIHIGNGDTVVDNAAVRAAPGGFSTAAELVVFTSHISGAITAASAAAQIGSATSAYAIGADVLFVVDNGSQTGVFRFHSAGHDALVSADELTQVALLGGELTLPPDYTFGP